MPSAGEQTINGALLTLTCDRQYGKVRRRCYGASFAVLFRLSRRCVQCFRFSTLRRMRRGNTRPCRPPRQHPSLSAAAACNGAGTSCPCRPPWHQPSVLVIFGGDLPCPLPGGPRRAPLCVRAPCVNHATPPPLRPRRRQRRACRPPLRAPATGSPGCGRRRRRAAAAAGPRTCRRRPRPRACSGGRAATR